MAWVKGSKHKFYEDRYRLLSMDVPIVKRLERGELFAVFDGIGSAPKGRQAAQEMADTLLKFYQETDKYPDTPTGLASLLMEGNSSIHRWGFVEGTDVPLGGCSGTVAWLCDRLLHVFHAGDTAGVFLKQGGNPIKLTRDHQMDSGAIYRYFGLGPMLQIETNETSADESDRILLLTDGVTKVISPLHAAEIAKECDDPSQAAKAVAQRALALGSIDDITVLIVEIE